MKYSYDANNLQYSINTDVEEKEKLSVMAELTILVVLGVSVLGLILDAKGLV